MDLQSLVNKPVPALIPQNTQYLEDLLSRGKGCHGNIFIHLDFTEKPTLSMFQLMLKYKERESSPSPEDFIEYLGLMMTETLCKEAENSTVAQSKSPEWYELRFGRITASKIYEASRCKTKEGSLVEAILGGAKHIETDAIKRGLILESSVIARVEKLKNIKINKSGLILSSKYPFLGASPDGITDVYCVEIKCPSKEKNIIQYVQNGIIKPKFYYQLQMQMFLTNKAKGLFCVAAPDFLTTQEVNITEVEINTEKCLEIINFAETFWKQFVFPVMFNM